MKNLIFTGIISGLALGASTVSQAGVFTTGVTAPTGSVLSSNETDTNANMTVRINGSGGVPDRTLGQSFTSSVAGSFDAITIQLGGGSGTTNNFAALTAGQGNLLLNVFDLSGPGTSLAASHGKTPHPVVYDMAGQDLSGLNNSFLTFELGETFSVDAGIEYGFEFGWDPAYIADSDDTIYRNLGIMRTVGGNVYAGGAQLSKTNYTSVSNVSMNSGTNTNDLDFYVHTVVPEPGTYALLAGLLALSSAMVRRRS